MEDGALLSPPADQGLVFTVDFITPIVDDAETFGAIAAANALSDVYAMGGEPQVALATCGFPEDRIGTDLLARIFQGGRDKAAEAGCAVVGGHTVVDPELKYGLCVIGKVDPERALRQIGARAGDRLVLTKPLGSGISAQAFRKGRIGDTEMAGVIALMTALNREAKDAALAAGASAATDVTGFGLLGHLHHLLKASGMSATLSARDVPRLDAIDDLAAGGFVPGGSKRNLEYVSSHLHCDGQIAESERLVLADAQTSGGLLVAVPPEGARSMVERLDAAGATGAAVIGEIEDGPAGEIRVAR